MNTDARRNWRSILLVPAALCLIFSLLSPAAYAQAESGSISVTKDWSGEASALPESVTVYLRRDSAIVQSLTLTAADAAADGSWQGSFDNVPLYDDNGAPIAYSIDEDTPEGWSFSVTQLPRPEQFSVAGWGEKVTPASSDSYSIGSANMLIAKKGNSYYVWTLDALSQNARRQLINAVNDAGLQGFGKALSEDNTSFASGLPASFENGVSLRESGGGTSVDFKNTSVWSLFYSGSYELLEARGAVLLNTAIAVETPPPTESPLPTPAPDAPPKTGDGELWPLFTMAGAALLGSIMLLHRLKEQKG